MNKGKFWKFFSIACIVLSLLLTASYLLGQAASPTRGSSLKTIGDQMVEENGEDQATERVIMAPSAILDDGFWYQGRLTDGDGNPLANTNIEVVFKIYDDPTTVTQLDQTTVIVNTDRDGLFNEELDFNNSPLFNGQALYLGLHVQGEASEMTPRQYLRPVPYALSIRPGAVIGGSLSLGDLGNHGYLYVYDADDVEVLRFSGNSAYLTLGGDGEDGDLIITNSGITTTFQVDGLNGHVYVFDGEDDLAENRLFEFDSTFVTDGDSMGAIWGDQTGNPEILPL
jgi:hypothetical protein